MHYWQVVKGWHKARIFLKHLLFALLTTPITTPITRHLHTWWYSFASPHCRDHLWPSSLSAPSTLNPPVLPPSCVSCLVLYTIVSMANISANCLASLIRTNGNRFARGSIHEEQETCYRGGRVSGISLTLLHAGQCYSLLFPWSRLTLLLLCTLRLLASSVCARRHLQRKWQPNRQWVFACSNDT